MEIPMDKTENNTVFIKNPNKRDRILVFQDKLKRHLSKEYLYIVDKKDDLENQLREHEIFVVDSEKKLSAEDKVKVFMIHLQKDAKRMTSFYT